MKRTILGAVVGGIVVCAATVAYDWWNLASIQSQPPENWLSIKVDIVDAGPGEVPMVTGAFEVFRPVVIRTTISPRNTETGESICQGRITTAFAEPASRPLELPVAALAGLDSCIWPAGRYVASITFTMTDLETNVQIKPIAIEDEFIVSR